MLIDVRKFAETERIYWEELEAILLRLERDPEHHLNLMELRRFHYLYERASADLAKVTTFVAENEIRHYLESLVAKAYGEIHETREKPHKFAPVRWFLFTFPETFHRNIRQFYLSLICTLVGTAFGAIAIGFDPQAKEILLPFPHLQESPAERVAREEQRKFDPMAGHKTTFSAALMTHNTRVSILALALGMTGGVGTILLLFYNGVILGAVSNDYAMAGQLKFLLGWLMPHGVIEIPAILIAGQAGFLIASALLGRGKRMSMRTRFREISADLVTLILGVSLLLVWAGIIESFLSQYHEPAIPYMLKIAFGVLELVLLILFLSRGARYTRPPEVRVTPIRNAAAP